MWFKHITLLFSLKMTDIPTEDSSNATVGSEDVKDADNIDAITGEVDVNKGSF